jgi:hypothetical protein
MAIFGPALILAASGLVFRKPGKGYPSSNALMAKCQYAWQSGPCTALVPVFCDVLVGEGEDSPTIVLVVGVHILLWRLLMQRRATCVHGKE